MNPPSALQSAMSRDRKPFTYTPGGLDLSEIKSERMAQRLMRNAMNQGVPEKPTQQIQSPPTSTPIAVPNFNCLPVQVFPTFNLPANPKSLLRTRSSPGQPREQLQMAPQPPPSQFVNNSKPTGPPPAQYDTCNKNTPTFSQTNNNRPASMYEYSTPSNNLMNYGSDGYTTVYPNKSYDAEYLQMPLQLNTKLDITKPSFEHIIKSEENHIFVPKPVFENQVTFTDTTCKKNNADFFGLSPITYINEDNTTPPYGTFKNERNHEFNQTAFTDSSLNNQNADPCRVPSHINNTKLSYESAKNKCNSQYIPKHDEYKTAFPDIFDNNKVECNVISPEIHMNVKYTEPSYESIKSDGHIPKPDIQNNNTTQNIETNQENIVTRGTTEDHMENNLQADIEHTEMNVPEKPVLDTIFVPETIVSKPIEDETGVNHEKKEVKIVKKQVIKKENNIESQNGENADQNGDADVQAVMTVKLPTKKSAAKTETKVEVTKKTLPDGSIEEIKKTITKTTIDGKTEIKTKTETTTIPKDDADEEVEEVEEEEEDNETVEVVDQEEENEEEDVEEPPVTVVKKLSESAKPKENGQEIIKTEERSETTTTSTKKVVVVQDVKEDQEEEEEEEEEIEEVESVDVVLKKPEDKPEPHQEKETVEETQEEEEEVEEQEQKVDTVVKQEEKEEVQKKELKKTDSVEEEYEEVEEEEEYEEAEEKHAVEKEETRKDDSESEQPEDNFEPKKEEVAKIPAQEPKTPTEKLKTPEPEDDKQEQKQEVVEEKQEVVVEEHEVKEEKKQVQEERLASKLETPEQKVPFREPSVPLEKVEDVEIKPIGAGDFITKSHTENREILTSVDKPTGLLTEINRIENIVTVNRTTKTLENTYENIIQQGIPPVKSYFTPHIEKIMAPTQPSRPYQPVYPSEPTTERRHSLLLERLSVERQMPSEIYQNNYQYNNQTVEQQRHWSQEPQAEVLTVSNVKPSQITNQQWYQQKENVSYDSVTPTPQPQTAPSWSQPKPQSQPLYQPQPQYQSQPQQQYQPPPQPQQQYQPPPQPQYQPPPKPVTPQPQYQPTYTENIQENTSTVYQNTYSTYTPKPSNWTSNNTSNLGPIPTINIPSQPTQYSYLNKDSTESYQKTTQQSSSYVPPPWEQDSTYVVDNSQNYYQPPLPTSTHTPAANQGWNPTPPASKFNKTPRTSYIPPKPNQSFVVPVSNVEPPKMPGRKTYYSEYERRYITVPESNYIPGETKLQPQPDPSPKYYYDNNEPAETVEPQWRKELREFTEKSQTETNVKPPWEVESKYTKTPEVMYTATPTWSQTLRPQSWRERSFESEFVSQEWPKTNTLGRGRPLSSYGKESIPERTRGVSVDRYNPNSYQSPVAAEHPPVQTHTHVPPAPHATGYHNPNVPAYHARVSAEPRDQPVSYQQPRQFREARASPFQSRSFKYLQWITGTDE